ncbi:MAG: uncharacterized membrane protein YhaH (DUF805 family) [Paracoccaceae bacterium]|jgi:uncharacterized membrane protein YhaH (DUF805 family)
MHLVGFGEAIKSCFNKYATFSGRAPRSEYWYFTLFLILAQIALQFVGAAIFDVNGAVYILLSLIFSLGTLLPTFSVAVRRLHDIGRTGWWVWISLVPLIGMIVMLIFTCIRSQPGGNRFGPNPLTGDEDIAKVFA